MLAKKLITLTELCTSWGVSTSTGKTWIKRAWLTPERIEDHGSQKRYYFPPDTPRPPDYKRRKNTSSKYKVTKKMLTEMRTTGDYEMSNKYKIPHHVFRHVRQRHSIPHEQPDKPPQEKIVQTIKDVYPHLAYKRELVPEVRKTLPNVSKAEINRTFDDLVQENELEEFPRTAKPKLINGKLHVSLSSIEWGITRQAKHQLWNQGRIPEAVISSNVLYVPADLERPTKESENGD